VSIIVNPKTIEANKRFIDEDLNRSFPMEKLSGPARTAETKADRGMTFALHAAIAGDGPERGRDAGPP
jgi:succinylglutamate desuccinylase